MCRLLIVALALYYGSSQVSACAAGYNTWWDGWCYMNIYATNTTYSNAAYVCNKRDLKIISIHSAEENAGILAAVTFYAENNRPTPFFIGLSCNTSTQKYVWDDGTPANYTNFRDAAVCDGSTHYYMDKTGKWIGTTGNSISWVACRAAQRSNSPCDDWSVLPSAKGDRCYSLSTSSQWKSWNDAENNCKENDAHLVSIHDHTTNDFVKRTALSNEWTGGVHIGLTNGGDGGNKYNWTDGTKIDYTNYGDDNADGDCFAMETSFMAGKWLDITCNNQRLPYMCTKNVFIPEDPQPNGCPAKTKYVDGEHVYSPSFPNAGGALHCEYILQANKGDRVEIEIAVLEANACCDYLDVYDGLFGDLPMTTLTGYTNDDIQYKRIKSTQSAMRLVWNATNPSNTRGFHIIVHSV